MKSKLSVVPRPRSDSRPVLILFEPPKAVHPDRWCGSFHRVEMVLFGTDAARSEAMAEEYRRAHEVVTQLQELFETRRTDRYLPAARDAA